MRQIILILTNILLLIFSVFSAINIEKDKILDGYTDSNGNYQWFENTTKQDFVDTNGIKWIRITGNRSYWNEADTIRVANISALIILGFDSISVINDIAMYDENSKLLTKLSKLNNSQEYTKEWKNAFNSDNFKFTAKKSTKVFSNTFRTNFVLKFYTQKGKIKNVNAIGLCHKGIIGHGFEAIMEISEQIYIKMTGNNNPNQDPIYDMHSRNAKKMIKMTKKKAH